MNNTTSSAEPIGREMNAAQRLFSRLKYAGVRFRRKLPYLVWWNDEIDLTVTLLDHKLNPESPFESLYTGSAAEAVDALKSMGLRFDTGCGCGGYDLEWDWSLEGPISCRFRGRAKRPHLRKSKPRPQLVVDNKEPAA